MTRTNICGILIINNHNYFMVSIEAKAYFLLLILFLYKFVDYQIFYFLLLILFLYKFVDYQIF